MCVDYRQLNSITYKDSYPLPHIDTCLGSMNGAVWFSTLDLRSGYYNIPIKESDKHKTAFITRRGCFRYKVMPFGLTCAPSVFQRLMDLVLCGLTYETCLVYLDDIIVFSHDFDSHVGRLREIFDRKPPVGRGKPPPHTSPPSVPRFSRLRRSISEPSAPRLSTPPPLKISGYATDRHNDVLRTGFLNLRLDGTLSIVK